ncbi:hypothetical protein FACS189472_04830 [Alphaproteobacteria bacterium]|nr:hypothetical protein FACS189472_04830 [Alphaproteobacteria bacterium]
MVLKFRDRSSLGGDEAGNGDMGASITPQYMIICEQFFSSDVEEYSANGSPCLWFEIGMSRLVTNDSTGQLTGDGRIVGDDPTVCMKYGSWAPAIQNALYAGTNIPFIGIRRFSSINGLKVIIQAIDYETCLIKTYRQKDDSIQFTFSAIYAQDVVCIYDNAGTKIGNSGSSLNYATLKQDKPKEWKTG